MGYKLVFLTTEEDFNLYNSVYFMGFFRLFPSYKEIFSDLLFA